jgi:amino acid transporter
MARAKAIPAKFGEVHPRFFTPFFSTWTFGILSIVWYVGLTLVSENILFDSIAALGLMIAFYYGFTGFACVVFYRKELFKSAKNFFYIGVCPTIGALMLTGLFFKSAYDLASPANSESGSSWFGVGPPLMIIVVAMILGAALMIYYSIKNPEFFNRKPKIVDPAILTGEATGVASFAAEED